MANAAHGLVATLQRMLQRGRWRHDLQRRFAAGLLKALGAEFEKQLAPGHLHGCAGQRAQP